MKTIIEIAAVISVILALGAAVVYDPPDRSLLPHGMDDIAHNR